MNKIIYTNTDEAPMLATFGLLPIWQRFAKPMGIEVSFAYFVPILSSRKFYRELNLGLLPNSDYIPLIM